MSHPEWGWWARLVMAKLFSPPAEVKGKSASSERITVKFSGAALAVDAAPECENVARRCVRWNALLGAIGSTSSLADGDKVHQFVLIYRPHALYIYA